MRLLRFCKKCQAETERQASGNCKPCAKSATAAYRAANPDIERARRAAYRAANKEKTKARNAAYNATNKEKIKAYNAARYAADPAQTNARSAAWRAANPKKARAHEAAWRAANPEKEKARHAAWKSANPEAMRIDNHNRRAQKRANGGTLSRGLSAKLFKLQKGKCACCGQPLGTKYHLDHIMPIALGGSNTDDNMQLLRSTCNQQKHAKHPVEFMQSRGFLL